MIFSRSQNLSSIEVSVGNKTTNNKIGDLNQIHFAILDHKDNYYDLASIQKYINIQIVHQLKTYEGPKEIRKNTVMQLKDCDESDFSRDEDQKRYYQGEIVDEGTKMLCLPQEANEMMI